MQRDLFKAAFQEFSRFDWPTYDQQFLEGLPGHLLRSAIKTRSFGDALLERLDRILSLLEEEGGHWNNPELYPSIFRLMRPGTDHDDAMRCLELQLGLVDLSPASFKSGFYREGGSRSRVRRIADGTISDLSSSILWRLGGSEFPVFYLPYPHLFDDVVGEKVYIGVAEIDRSDLESMVRGAQSALRGYSPELHDGFCDAIGSIALVGIEGGLDRSSYSARMNYAGGIFCSFLNSNVPALLENIVHEYYHQRLWVWWTIEPPDDLPPEDVTIVSPITHLDRSVQVMVHALMIYIGVASLYTYCLDNLPLAPPTRAWAERRLAMIQAGIETLPCRLRERLAACPKTLGFVNFLADLHRPAPCSAQAFGG